VCGCKNSTLAMLHIPLLHTSRGVNVVMGPRNIYRIRKWFMRNLGSLADHDVVVIGGGMVGATLACLLGGSEVGSVCLIDPTVPSVPNMQNVQPFPDLRVSAISPGSARILTAAGAWPPARSTEFRHMQVCDNRGQISFESSGDKPLGYITENSLLTSSLHHSLHTRGVTVYQTAAVSFSSPKNPNDWPVVQLKEEKYNAVTGRLVVGADGGKSVVRSHMSPPTTGMYMNRKSSFKPIY
jgi:2-polyprenyl-6-methoxyphenol hydroxylase-like FAD-dependent oxidoreductase